jgi:multiple sugar transport system substrate-binding protein
MYNRWKTTRSKSILLFAHGLLVLSLLAACAGGGAPGTATQEPIVETPGMTEPAVTEPAETEPAATEPAGTEPAATEPAGETGEMADSIRVAVVRGAMIDTMAQFADAYEQAHPGVTINVEEEPEGGAFDALIAAGNQPDVIVASFGSQIGRLANTEAVLPLEDMPGYQELVARLEQATVQELYGHNYYIPAGADVTMMIYNKQLFEEAGLDPDSPPATWQEFLEAAEAIQALPAREDGSQVYGTVFWNDALAWGGWYWNMLQPMYLNANQAQCQLLNRLGTGLVFDQPECQLQQFFEFNASAQEFAPPTMEKSFFSRTIGMWPQYGYSWEPNLREAEGEPMVIGEDVGVAPVPVPNEGDTPYTTYGGRALMILKTSPDRQNLAWDFIKFLMEDENNLTFITELGYLPVITSLKADPYFQDPARQPFVAALENAILPEQTGTAEDVANEILGVYQLVAVERSISPEEAVQEAATRAQAKLQ